MLAVDVDVAALDETGELLRVNAIAPGGTRTNIAATAAFPRADRQLTAPSAGHGTFGPLRGDCDR